MRSNMQPPKHEIMSGDRALDFVLPAPDGKFYQFYEKTRGNPSVLLFYPGKQPKAWREIETFIEKHKTFEELGLDIFAVTTDASEQIKGLKLPFMVWIDQEKKITEHYLEGAGIAAKNRNRSTAFLLDRNQRVISVITGAQTGHAKRALEIFRKQPSPPSSHTLSVAAPALIIPN